MIPDKYYVAYRHAHILKALGSHTSHGEDVSILLDIAVKNGMSALRLQGCDLYEASVLLVDAINYELIITPRVDAKGHAALQTALDIIDRRPHH